MIYDFDTVTSTNDVLQEMAEQGAPEGTAVIARHQTAGRGRMGRSFYSPADTGMYLSILLRPAMPPQDVLSITPMAAVAVADAVKEVTGIDAGIKWVNDLFYHGRKFCGILAQSKSAEDGTSLAYVLLGIGINLSAPQNGFPSDLQEIAGALYDTASPVTPEMLAYAVHAHVMDEYTHLHEKHYLKPYRERLCMLGKPILVAEQDVVREAVALEVDDDLRLLVRYENGETAWRSTGEIRIRTK